MNDKNQSQSVLNWMASERLYEEYLFFYLLIIVFWGFIGLFSFGFELSGYSLQQNLLFNFIWFLTLTITMAFTPIWYRLIFGRKSRLQRRSEKTQQQIEAIKDPIKREAIKQHIANDGGLAPRTLQKWSLIFLGWCALFEMFFVTSWVKDLALVWQPEWVNSVIDWVRANTNVPPLNVDRKLFLVKLSSDDSGSAMLKQMFGNEQVFLTSVFGRACLLYHAWHVLSFFPILIASIICLWQLIGWTGANQLETKRGIGGYCLLVVITFFMTLMFIGGLFMFIQDVGYRAGSVTGLAGWVHDLWLNIAYFFIILALRLYTNWFLIFKNMLIRH
ncbi:MULTISPECIES: hypothetical protein [Acinetobacter]|uniref:hypothetical protein n=1 Tax=Acinetobacter TaxID=469 RepID=UPI000C5419BE|nr:MULTISPECIES: hypothetical protein [Acinetobacter]MBC67573.1 hypothetical protein [Acinetobacter sp.]MBT49055.1 hypothetical protein [Acinetobacter sp.]HIQ35989.1 hypothetical protein [Acinetobacter venetianus]HJP47141.1 hypothetical protein [Acinetobacter venetianus]